MKQLGEEVPFFHSGWPLTGTVVQVTLDPGLGKAEYVLQCDKFFGVRFHFNPNDEMIWIENVLQ